MDITRDKPVEGNQSPIKSLTEDSPLRRALEQPPLKRFKVGKTKEVGTVTDPDSLGPCEPGTTIAMDGIVWNETKGGLLSLNITWRGKSFMGTLMDTSTTDHGSEWASPWVADTLAPDLKPKVSRNKKKKNKKKRKKRKDLMDQNPDVSLETIEEETINKEKDASREMVELVKCEEINCDKKFLGQSALRYHVSYSHEKINREKIIKEEKRITEETDTKVEPKLSVNFLDKYSETKSDMEILNQNSNNKKQEESKSKSTPFPSTQNIRPIVPVLSPQIAGMSLKLIQPKPTILPEPAKNLCLDNLINLSKKSPIHNMEKSQIQSINANKIFTPNNQKISVEEPIVIDLSKQKDESVHIEKKEKHSQLISLLGNDKDRHQKKVEQKYQILGNAITSNKDQFINEERSNVFPLKIPNPSNMSMPKRNPSISVKMEFNTGQSKNLAKNSAVPDVSSKPQTVNTNDPTTSPNRMPSNFPPQLGYIPHAFYSTQGVVPGLMMPPLNTNPLMLPGLLSIPQTATSSSPFGASLESLARAAEERAKNFGNFSPAHVPASFSPAHVPAGFSPAHISAAAPPVQRNCPPPTSDSSEAPLLRHEHMHTHLHYITSPTHSQ